MYCRYSTLQYAEGDVLYSELQVLYCILYAGLAGVILNVQEKKNTAGEILNKSHQLLYCLLYCRQCFCVPYFSWFIVYHTSGTVLCMIMQVLYYVPYLGTCIAYHTSGSVLLTLLQEVYCIPCCR